LVIKCLFDHKFDTILGFWNTERVENNPRQRINQSLPTEQAASPKKNYNFKKTFWIFFITSILITVVAGGGYLLATKQSVFLSQNQQKTITPPTEQSTPTPTLDLIANWKTYRDSDFGFEFKYPAEFGAVYPDRYFDKAKYDCIKGESAYFTVSSFSMINPDNRTYRFDVNLFSNDYKPLKFNSKNRQSCDSASEKIANSPISLSSTYLTAIISSQNDSCKILQEAELPFKDFSVKYDRKYDKLKLVFPLATVNPCYQTTWEEDVNKFLKNNSDKLSKQAKQSDLIAKSVGFFLPNLAGLSYISTGARPDDLEIIKNYSSQYGFSLEFPGGLGMRPHVENQSSEESCIKNETHFYFYTKDEVPSYRLGLGIYLFEGFLYSQNYTFAEKSSKDGKSCGPFPDPIEQITLQTPFSLNSSVIVAQKGVQFCGCDIRQVAEFPVEKYYSGKYDTFLLYQTLDGYSCSSGNFDWKKECPISFKNNVQKIEQKIKNFDSMAESVKFINQ
jgi:hypothetical protein